MQLPCCRRAKKQSRPLSTEAAPSLGDKIKASTASAVLAVIANTTSSFDRTIAGISVTTMTAGAITCKLTVHRGIENAMGALHGGAVCTLVDLVGTFALMTLNPTNPGVSVELNTSFLSSAKAGDVLRIEGRVIKPGRRLGFTQVDIYKDSDGTLVATGRHTKAFT